MIKSQVRKLARRLGFHLERTAALPYGFDSNLDIQRLSRLWEYRIGTIFDVGANVGQSALRFSGLFPEANVVAFEPTAAVFHELASNVAGNDRVQPEHLALGGESGEADLYTYDLNLLNSIVPNTAHRARYSPDASVTKCKVETIDRYCDEKKIASIDLLKISTMGSELEVLKGAKHMLAERRIRFIIAEFTNLLPSQETVGGGLLLPIAELIIPYGYKFIATYTTYVETKGEYFVAANVLFVHR